MTSLTNHHSSKFVKLLLIGDSKSGKTTSLADLVAAGYFLRVLDLDNLLDPLVAACRERCPDKLGNVEFRTIRDERKMTDTGPVIDGMAKAFTTTIKMLDRWAYTDTDGTKVDLGNPWKWGDKCILVIDSLSRLCDSCFDWREPLTPRGKSGEYDKRATYKDAQDAVEDTIAELTSKAYETNVIVICHGVYQDLPDGTTKIFPQGVGQKLSPKIPQYFPSYIRYKNVGGRRTIQLKSDVMIDLANPDPAQIPDTLPMEGGLGTFFELLRGEKPKPTAAPAKPMLKRA